MFAVELGAKLMIKIRLITFRAMRGPKPGVFNYLFAKDSLEKLKKGAMNNLRRCVVCLGKTSIPGMSG